MDDNVNLPEAVRKQLEEAERIQQQILQEQQGEAQQAVAEESPPQETAVQEQPQAETEPAKEVPREETVEYWRERYKTLKGKYDAEVPRLHDQTRTLSEQIQNLTQQLMALRAEMEERQAAKEEPEKEEPPQYISEEDVDLHGKELVDFVVRATKQVLAESGFGRLEKRLSKIDERVKQLEEVAQTVVGTQAKTAQQTLLQALRERVPDVEEINESSEFAEWVSQPDPLTGITRMELAQQAAAAFDIDRLVAVFEQFKKDTGWRSKKGNGAAQPEAKPSPAQEKKLESMIEPSQAVAPVDVNALADARRIWTESEYQRVFDPRFIRQVGDEQATRLQALADKAVREGRIKWGA